MRSPASLQCLRMQIHVGRGSKTSVHTTEMHWSDVQPTSGQCQNSISITPFAANFIRIYDVDYTQTHRNDAITTLNIIIKIKHI